MDQKEKYVLSLIKDKVKVVFDIGAREDGIEFIEILPEAEYHFFEPHKDFCDSLKTKIPDGVKAYVNQHGMWDENLDGVTYYSNTQSFIKHPFGLSADSGHVYDLRTIDWYVKQNKVSSIDFLKIDAEGSDYRILMGAQKIISQDKIMSIQFEYWDGVKKFHDLLNEKYHMFFIRDENTLSYLNPEVIQEIDGGRIPSGLGGDIFCIHKKENFSI